MANPVQEKSYWFAKQLVKYYHNRPKDKIFGALDSQLLRSGTSIGANVEEAIGGISKKDFINKMCIGLKEARESNYWLRLLRECREEEELSQLQDISEELIRILTAIVKTSQA